MAKVLTVAFVINEENEAAASLALDAAEIHHRFSDFNGTRTLVAAAPIEDVDLNVDSWGVLSAAAHEALERAGVTSETLGNGLESEDLWDSYRP